MEAIIFCVILYFAVKQAASSTKAAWGKSRKAYAARAAAAGRKPGGMLRHDLGYAAAQLRHGFPNARNGFATGWHEARKSFAGSHAGREKAKAERAESLAALIEQVREYRERQAAAAERIRTSAAQGTPEGSDEGTPGGSTSPGPEKVIPGTAEDVPGESGTRPHLCWSCFAIDGDEHKDWCATRRPVWPDDTDGPTYSWGLEGAPHHWPAANRAQAERQAQAASRDGRTHVVLEYPPGGGQGQVVAAFRDDEPFVCPASEDDLEDEWDAPLPGEDEPAGGQAQQSANPQNTGGTPVSDTTYDGVVRDMSTAVATAEQHAAEANAAMAAAESHAQAAADAKTQAMRISEDMQALDVDPETLGAMADHLDAADAAEKAHHAAYEAAQAARAADIRVMETAQNADATLKRGHAGLAAAHQEAPVQAASREFYTE